MKRFFCLLILFGLAQIALAQTFDMNTLEVRDSSGVLYPAASWQPMVATGKYNLRLLPGNKTALISKLSPEELDRRLASLPKPVESKFFKTGDKIGSIDVRDIEGKRLGTKQLTGKIVVLNFWFINCGPCRMEIPDLNETVQLYKDNPDVVFIAVALDEQRDLSQFLRTTPYNYHIIDNGRYIASKYGVTTYPTHVVVDKEGKILFHTSGLAMNTIPWLKKSIDAALGGTTVK